VPPLNPWKGAHATHIVDGEIKWLLRIYAILGEHQLTPHGGEETGIDHQCSGIGEIPAEIFRWWISTALVQPFTRQDI
jgi:hypothetical protein